ncbi:pyroglutamyl-peptidase I [Lederbergia wuyishanensis]|uniref:Pyrrolidone-carboxylate peptidase n=1 Tax=Lederbergia wuyishanensis TaxID=1347903 RepID=A0ABU0D5U8_9BACI|nr:pyroglutamyl-peptidase I [Lederbergia wuyishanensis]MCJ8008326.1 pyroglutamyl-peptidase I [Lederbergia wuyishanensis]MDQ0343738.1 pyroglutamyl-peptidase [Lederbergia wuyishanensis]
MGKKVLITGFDPFGGEKINPALEAVKQLDGKVIEGVEIVAQEVPTVFHESIKVVIHAIEQHNPDIVICVGQAGGRTQVTPERVAINIDDARIPDNKDNQPIDEPIHQDGPAAYWTTLPIKRIVHEMKKAGVPASVSNSAGTFVCNHLFYGVMHYLEKNAPHIRGGFIHIPFIPEQTLGNNAPSLSLDLIVEGIKTAAVVAAKENEDIREIGGTTH